MADGTYRNTAPALGMVPELELMLVEADVAREARNRYTQTSAYQSALRAKYQRLHFFYQPPVDADQWPEDVVLRPGKIHITTNIIKPAVNIDARLQSILPRISLKPDSIRDEDRRRAEGAEKLVLEWLDLSDWDVWLGSLNRVRSLYGKGILKVFWNKEAQRPDVIAVENPANLRVGWGSSDFRIKDWALYEYALSPQEISVRFPHCKINPIDGGKQLAVTEASDHTDPLNQKTPLGDMQSLARPIPYQPSDYESKQLRVWDYWYKKPDGKGGFTVCNAMFVEGTMVTPAGETQRIREHSYLPDIPYIVIREDAEPGNPEGLSVAEDLIDVQIELNRALSHWAQLVADEVDPAWVAEGDNSALPAGIVPKAGEIVHVGNNKVHALEKGFQVFPVTELIGSFWDHYHKVSGLSEILFGQVPGAQTSGRAVAIQVEAAANRLDPRRKQLYSGLKDLLVYWTIMAERVNPKFDVTDPESGQVKKVGVKALIQGFRRWKIIAPEITPRDAIENTQNEINKVNAGLSSMKTSMDELGIDSPEAELDLVRQENMDAQLHPEKVQSYAALMSQMQQMQQVQQQMQQQMQGLPTGAGPLNPQGVTGSPLAAGQTAANAVQQQQFAAQPTNVGEDQNQPQTQAGMPPPAGGQGPQSQTLIRGRQVLNQTAIRS